MDKIRLDGVRLEYFQGPLAVQLGVEDLASEISGQLALHQDVTAVLIMDGAMFFGSQLLVHCPPLWRIDFIHAASYGDALFSSGNVVIDRLPKAENIQDRTILLLDDISDSGQTLSEISKVLKDMGAADIFTATLVCRMGTTYPPTWSVFETEEDDFLVGCGMDYKGVCRNLRGLWRVVKAENQQV